MAFDPQLLNPERSAHASIRGYLYQACLGAKRWLELKENEALLCEGDEDLDRLLLDGGGLSEQVKALSGDVNIRELRETLRHFLGSYVALRRAGEERRFLFTTTARRRRQRTGDLGVDVLDAWEDLSQRPAVIEAVRRLLEGDAAALEALAWLDGEDDRWPGFFDAVEWHFKAPDLETIRRQIGRDLAARPETRDLPEKNAVDRIVAMVLDRSRQDLPALRLLTRKDLERFLESVRTELAEWAASASAVRLRGVFAEMRQLDRLLYDGRRPLPPGKVRPSKLLTAAYEVVPFEEQGRREELDALAEWCAAAAKRSVQLLTGEGGMGKTFGPVVGVAARSHALFAWAGESLHASPGPRSAGTTRSADWHGMPVIGGQRWHGERPQSRTCSKRLRRHTACACSSPSLIPGRMPSAGPPTSSPRLWIAVSETSRPPTSQPEASSRHWSCIWLLSPPSKATPSRTPAKRSS